ncbi:MAG TPA: PEP-CTERM sorting domain-containing protein [Bryobacteraceae bacterium]
MLSRPAVSLYILLSATAIPALASPVAFAVGNVYVAVGHSEVSVFTPTGTLLGTLNDGSATTYTTGMTFDSAGSLFVTNFGTDNISKFDSNGNLISSTFFTGADNTPESILVNAAGNFLVGGPTAAIVYQYSPSSGAPTTSYTVQGGNGTGGTDWTDLEANQTTLLYDGEGTEILSYNLATRTQNAPFATGLPGSDVYEFRIIPTGTFAGDVLAADSSAAILLNASGAVIKTYTLPGNDGSDFALNLDPNGVDFWTADTSGTVWEVNEATGAIVEQWSSGSTSTFGLVVAGQITASGPPPVVPEPGTFGLMGAGLALTVAVRYRSGRRV